MTIEVKVTLAGAAALAFGVFAPVISIPFVGSMNLFANGEGDGALLLPVAALIGALALWRMHLAGVVVGVLAALFVGYKFVGVRDLLAVDDSNALLAGTIQLQWGWLALATGAVMAVAGPIAANRRTLREAAPATASASPIVTRAVPTAVKRFGVIAAVGAALIGAALVGYRLAPGEERHESSVAERQVPGPQLAANRERPPSSSETQVPPVAVSRLPSEPEPTPAPPDPFPHFGDGTHVVGSDIAAGTYRTRVAAEACYWERLRGFGGSEILANDFTDLPAVVTVDPSDAGFRSKGCGTWTQDLSAITTSRESFADGTYIVGTDLKPGTYRGAGGERCYWERLSGFGGGAVVENGLEKGAPIVTIAKTDKGFASKGCGSWSRIP